MPIREIICADALEWLAGKAEVGAVVTSLPDAEEIGLGLPQWREWFFRAAGLSVAAASASLPAIFYQTDRRADGALASKACLVAAAAEAAGARMLWHKIVPRLPPGQTDLYRPGFTHLLAFSRKGTSGKASPDIIERGPMVYENAMGLRAAGFAVRFAREASAGVIVDPFCGRGTVPAVADALGLDSIGVDIDSKQCEAARALRLGLA